MTSCREDRHLQVLAHGYRLAWHWEGDSVPQPAYEDGMCKFHLDGYLDASTADEMRGLFWKQHGKTTEVSLLNCSGYVLPSLAIEGGPQVIRRQLCLDNAVFGPDGADLSGLTFEQPASFRAAKFKGGANFQYCTFKKGADFSHAEFLGAARFEGSRFDDHTRFSRAAFGKSVFDWARLEKASFDRSTFKKAASFYECAFFGGADFRDAVFRGKSYFTGSEFDAGTDFSGSEFAQPMHFRDVKAKCPSLVKFDGNVSNVSFLDTDLKEIAFGSRTTWSPRPAGADGKIRSRRPGRAASRHSIYSIWNKKWRTYDEKILDDGGRDLGLNHENIKNVYRDLRDNFDRNLAYDVSGGFFVREMEVSRIYKNDVNGRIIKRHPLRRIFTWHAAYNILSEYGQSLGRPLLCLAAIFGAGLSLLWFPTGVSHAQDVSIGDCLRDSAVRTLTSMMPIPFSAPPTEVDIGLKIASLPALGTFLVALRRRFEKSRRH